jgi:CO/xanthine dehydrogenase Mo-binding subunit
VQGYAALFAAKVQRPVKVRLNREESIMMHPKRHPVWMQYDVGCDSDGMLTYVKAKFIGDTGAYASVGMKVMERCAGHATGGYHVPNVDIESLAVYTNNIPSGAMRGFGVNQATFGIESCIDELCEQGGFDRWQFRYDNALVSGSMTATGQVLGEGVGMRATLDAVKETFYEEEIAGIACGVKNTGIGNGMPEYSEVSVIIGKNGKVDIRHGWTEMGQGVNTVAIQALCHETGIEPDCVGVSVDTTAEHVTGMTTASRATSLMCNAVIDACATLKVDIDKYGLDRLEGKKYFGKWGVDWTTELNISPNVEQKTHYSYSYATQIVILDDDGFVKKIVAAHDAGRIFNPTLFEGQIEGSIHMGLGYAVSEDLPMKNGRLHSSRLRNCGILRAKEMPEMEIIGVEVPDPYGPYGGKGVGEIGLVPTAAAVANALYAYDGKRRTTLPMEGNILRKR